jgi:hypothetical protein
VTIKVTSTVERTPSEWFSEIIRPFGRLLDFATGVPNNLVELYFYFPTDDSYDESGLSRCPAFHTRSRSGKQPERSIHASEMLFTLRDIGDNFPSVIERWLDASRSLGDVLDLYFGAPFEGRPPTRERFFSLIRALEAYHRRVIQQTDEPEEEHNRRIDLLLDMIPSDFPDDFRDWVDGKLRFAYEPTLRRRVTEFLRTWQEITTPLIGNSERRGRFVSGVVDTRNCLTHPSGESCERAFSGLALSLATGVLTQIADAYLLRHLGIDGRACVELISRREGYGRLRRRIEESGADWRSPTS